jgi:hypothetical protein
MDISNSYITAADNSGLSAAAQLQQFKNHH